MILIQTELKSTNHEGVPITVRVDETWKEIGILAGEKTSIYIPLRKVNALIAALTEARDKATGPLMARCDGCGLVFRADKVAPAATASNADHSSKAAGDVVTGHPCMKCMKTLYKIFYSAAPPSDACQTKAP